MGLEEEYQKVKKQVDSLNERIDVDEDNLGLGYLDMNSRMLQIEEDSLKDKDLWDVRQEEHQKRKEKIENYWHKSTIYDMKELKKKIPKDKKGNDISRRKPEHYANFTLKDLEIVIKNSQKGENDGNSQKYNDVATDLELFNALAGELDDSEKLEYLERLAQSCNEYINHRHPWSRQGRRRKAMIEQIYSKVQAELLRIRNAEAAAIREINEANDPKQIPQATVEKALRVKFRALSQQLQQEVQGLTIEDMRGYLDSTDQDQQEDKELVKIAEALMLQNVGEDQSPTLSTKFFNAIGWTKRTPVRSTNFSEDLKKSPIKVKLYHTINAPESSKDNYHLGANDMMFQLVGRKENSRQYSSCK